MCVCVCVEGTFTNKIRNVTLEKTEGDIQRHIQLSELKSLSCTDSEQIPELWSTRYLQNCSSLCLEPLAKTQTARHLKFNLCYNIYYVTEKCASML
jgi:hypothetical protein